jgi:hypothetical protein
LPVTGPLPHISHFFAMVQLLKLYNFGNDLCKNGLYTCSYSIRQAFSKVYQRACIDSLRWLC